LREPRGAYTFGTENDALRSENERYSLDGKSRNCINLAWSDPRNLALLTVYRSVNIEHPLPHALEGELALCSRVARISHLLPERAVLEQAVECVRKRAGRAAARRGR